MFTGYFLHYAIFLINCAFKIRYYKLSSHLIELNYYYYFIHP